MLLDIPRMLRPAARQTTNTLRTSLTPKPGRLFPGSFDAALTIVCLTRLSQASPKPNEKGGFAGANPPLDQLFRRTSSPTAIAAVVAAAIPITAVGAIAAVAPVIAAGTPPAGAAGAVVAVGADVTDVFDQVVVLNGRELRAASSSSADEFVKVILVEGGATRLELLSGTPDFVRDVELSTQDHGVAEKLAVASAL